jgi:spastin
MDSEKTFKQHHKKSFKLLSEALDLDSQNLLKPAIVKYKQGLFELDSALSFSELPSLDSQTIEKLRTNKKQVESRILELEPLPKRTTSRHVMSTSNSAVFNPSATPKSTKQDKPIAQTPSTKPEIGKDFKATFPNVDAQLATRILNDALTTDTGTSWNDIAGLESAKKALNEIVILPSLRPELFTGLRAPAKGVLLFGPPGTGKTLLAKALASESNSRFFNMSASSLTSKFVGEGEKLVRALFAVARFVAPSVIFIDEIDSILSERSEGEHEASRRLKTEFLLQFDGVAVSQSDRVLVLGATNRPQELDEAIRRRFPKRIYIPLPEPETRRRLLEHLLSQHKNNITARHLTGIVNKLEGYSGSDMTALAKEAALEPIRELGSAKLLTTDVHGVRAISAADFDLAISQVRPSVSKSTVEQLESWNKEFGSI